MKTAQLKIILLLALFCLPQLLWAKPTLEQINQWETTIQAELKLLPAMSAEKEWLLLMSAAREFKSYGYLSKAKQYYLKGYEHSYEGDKSEAVIELVSIAQQQKKELPKALERAKTWFKNNPVKLTKPIEKWLLLIEGYAKGETPTQKILSNHHLWATEQRVHELMLEKKFKDAFQLVGGQPLQEADINSKIRYDLLSSLALGKKATPKLWCEETLGKYPNSITWSMRVCRYLKAWREGKTSKESVKSISEQLKKESPEREFWAKSLEHL